MATSKKRAQRPAAKAAKKKVTASKAADAKKKNAAAKTAAAKKAAAKKTTVKTAAAKKTAPRKTAAKKAPAKKVAAKKAPTRKTAAKKTVAWQSYVQRDVGATYDYDLRRLPLAPATLPAQTLAQVQALKGGLMLPLAGLTAQQLAALEGFLSDLGVVATAAKSAGTGDGGTGV